MLVEVEIRDFAIIQQARVELGPGFCVLSGETGAGKSIIVDALGALLGERVGGDLVRSGRDAARLQAAFDLRDAPAARARLEALGVAPDADGLCLISREIRADGRGRCRINGGTATVTMLRELGESLIDLHGQHEHQSLLRPAEHLALLDAAGGTELAAQQTAYRAAYEAWQATLRDIAALRLDEGEKARRADMLRFQVAEIEAAGPRPGEVEELDSERRRLAHAERLVEAAAEAHGALAEGDEGPAAADRVAAALAALRDMARFDDDLGPLADELGGALATIEEAARTLQHYAESIDADPRRLAQVEERLEQLDRLCRKYGGSVEAVLAFGARAVVELAEIETADERLAALEAQLGEAEAEAARLAEALSSARAAAGEALAAGVAAHLAELGMTSVGFVAAMTRRPDAAGLRVGGERVAAGPTGVDSVELLLSSNPGEPPRPLSRIASGGELSRVMLAIKSQLAEGHGVPTMVFDEIDAGIGGVTIGHVGRKMAALARRRQVICITHHAPLAALADWHLVVDKSGDEPVRVDVARVDGEVRVHELARMLGRMPPTEATLAMARELLAESTRG